MKRQKYFFSFLAAIQLGCSATPDVLIDYTKPSVLEEIYQKGKEDRLAGRADECLKTFSKLIELRKLVKDSLYVYSLYQSGLCFEMKNEPGRAIGVYQDALKVSGVLPADFSQMEIPSRLAICYGRVGEKEVSERYYETSKKYLSSIVANKQEFIRNRDHYAEVFSQMGSITNQYVEGIDFDSYLRSIRYSQEYLALALQLNVHPYSKQALEQMIDNLSRTYDFIQNITAEKLADETVALRLRQNKQKTYAATLLKHIDGFNELTKSEKNSEQYVDLYKKLYQIQYGLETLVAQRPAGEGLTPEAQKLQKIKIEGQLVPIPEEALPIKNEAKE